MVPGTLTNVLYTPKMSRNLFSVTHCVKQGKDVVFDANKMECRITQKGRVVGVAHLKDNLWILDGVMAKYPDQEKEDREENAYLSSHHNSMHLWHLRYGHLGVENLKKLKEKCMVNGLDFKDETRTVENCQGCIAGKHHRLPFPQIATRRETQVLELIHSDVLGPIWPDLIGGKKYVLTFIDDSTRRSLIYLMKYKSEVMKKFIEWKALVERQSERKIKCIRSDNGGEFMSTEFVNYLRREGIQHQTTMPRSPQ